MLSVYRDGANWRVNISVMLPETRLHHLQEKGKTVRTWLFWGTPGFLSTADSCALQREIAQSSRNNANDTPAEEFRQMLDLHHLRRLTCDILHLTFFCVSLPRASFSFSDPSLLRTTEVDSRPLFSWTGSFKYILVGQD